MKISLCITVLNEEKSIQKLLDSIFNQTKLPDEIVIVDAGSTDGTQKIIKKYKKVKLIVSQGISIAKGRNLAIKHAGHEIIVMTDAGCICHKDWLAKITNPFTNSKTQVVAGFYKMTGNTDFQKALKPFLGIMPEKFNKYKFLPSARSIAFKKSVWEKVGGFNEKFDRAGEDTDFNKKILDKNLKIVRRKDALVDWEVPDNLKVTIEKFYFYAKGDALSGNFTSSHNIKVISIFTRYIIFSVILISSLHFNIFYAFVLIMFFYFGWSIFKQRKFVKKWKERQEIVIIQLASDFAVMTGFLSGIWDILKM